MKNSEPITSTRSQWAAEQHNKLHTLSTVFQRCKVLTSTSTLPLRLHSLSFWSTLHSTGTSMHEALITVKRLRVQSLSSTLAANPQELVTFMTGRLRSLTIPCPSVTSCSPLASYSAEFLIQNSTKLWLLSSLMMLWPENAIDSIADHQLQISPNHHQHTLLLKRLNNSETRMDKLMMSG